jgi:hypothetical protein
MTMNGTSHCFVRRDVAPVGEIAAVMLGLTILGYIAGTHGE